eukprot:Mycagemm_TRINITY_DN10005_c0_g1::TRINITY_DN10005_c0_g1_i2::g.2280::m.2280 type:complete len:103 gc:universal TRINITY_DN10005_c0_g1_i2:674-366(-)
MLSSTANPASSARPSSLTVSSCMLTPKLLPSSILGMFSCTQIFTELIISIISIVSDFTRLSSSESALLAGNIFGLTSLLARLPSGSPFPCSWMDAGTTFRGS